MEKQKAPTYKFRQDPVAYCGKSFVLRLSCYYRQPKFGMVKRLNCGHGKYGYDEEDCFQTNKYKEQHLPCWDDRPRHIDRCWKTSFKVKKQWEKHTRKK